MCDDAISELNPGHRLSSLLTHLLFRWARVGLPRDQTDDVEEEEVENAQAERRHKLSAGSGYMGVKVCPFI